MDNNNFNPPNQLNLESQRHHSMDGGILVSPPPSAQHGLAPIFGSALSSQHGFPPTFSFPALQRISNSYSPSPQSINQNPAPEFPESNPPTIEDLRAQRTYLLTTLQRENTKAQYLLSKIPALPEPPSPKSPPPTLPRKTRKRISWLRYRLNETNNQEAAILTRLNQLTTEIQRLEHKERMEMEKEHYEQLHASAMKAVEALPLDLMPTVRGPVAFSELRVTTPMLDPKSPCFEPKGFGYPFPMVPSPPSPKNKMGKVDEEFSFLKEGTRRESDDEASRTTRTPTLKEAKEEGRKVRPLLEHRSSSLDSANCNKLLTGLVDGQRIFKRQNSLPVIPFI